MSYAFNNIRFLLPSTLTKDYIFDYNPANSLIIFPLNSSLILPITFFNSIKEPLNLLDSYLNQTNAYLYKNLLKHHLFQFHRPNCL